MRRRLLLLACLALLIPGTALGTTYGPGDLRYAYDVRVDGAALTATGTIAVRNDADAPLDVLWLRAWGNDGYGCAHPAVRLRVLAGGTAIGPNVQCTALGVRLRAPIDPGGTGTVRVAVSARLPQEAWRTGSFGSVRSFGGVLPTVAPIVNGSVDLAPPITLGDAWLLLPGRWDVAISVPRGTAAATSGTATGRLAAQAGRDRRRYVNERAREFTIVTGPMRVVRRTASGVPVAVFAGPGTSPAVARRSLRTVTRAIATFADRYGAYPGGHLDVVLAGEDGMEYPDLVLSEPTSETLPHEVAHQWFSQEVASNGFTEPWIDETFTTYVQMRLLGLVRDCDVAAPLAAYRPARLSWTLAEFARHPDRIYQAVYDGGACAFEGIARSVGAARFDAMLREWVALHRWGQVTTADWLTFLGDRVPADVLTAFTSRTGLSAG